MARKVSLRDDPFAPREGKKLTWTGVNMTTKTKENPKKILQNIWGEVPPCQTTAIMGPSGAGKTSLLNILAGRAKSNSKLDIDADVRLNNHTVNPTKLSVRKQIAFVAQDDSLTITATPREAIRFSARLRLPGVTTEEELDVLVNLLIEELGLSDCADTMIGGGMIKGVSGGERKRTSVGVELVTKPAIIFLDEPTSGLDSFSAVQLMQVLKKVAQAGASVLFTIHQPSSDVFASFDHLILLNRGRIMYQGAVSAVPDYFGNKGHPVPKNFNPADWIIDVAQTNSVAKLDSSGFFPKDHRDLPPPSTKDPNDSQHDDFGQSLHGSTRPGNSRVSYGTEIRMLYQREIRALTRNKGALVARFGITIFINLLMGLIYYQVGVRDNADPVSFQSHTGALIQVLIATMFSTAQPALQQFPLERPVFLREYSTDHYSVGPYFLSKLSVEAILTLIQCIIMTIVTYFLMGFQLRFFIYLLTTYLLAMASTALAVFMGSFFDSPTTAQELFPLLIVPQLLFAGFFVATTQIPAWLRWAQYLCSLTYAVRIALVNEFGECAETDMGMAGANCRILLEKSQIEIGDEWAYWLILACIFTVFRLWALLILKKKATSFH